MKVSQFLPDHKLGGMQQIAYILHVDLVSRGFEMETHALKPEDQDPAVRSLGHFRAWTLVTMALRRRRADAVITHAPRTAVFVATAAWLARVPQRMVVQHCASDDLSVSERRALHLLLWLGCLTHVVFVGEVVRESFTGASARVLRRSSVIRNGMPPNESMTAPTAPTVAQPERFRALVVSRLVSSKNVATAVEAVVRTGAPVDLIIAGDGPELASLEKQVALTGAPVKLLGRQSRAELDDLYRSADLLIFPTTHAEGLPLVLIEAAHAGLPVIASDMPQNREVMGEAALYCDPTDVDEWSRAIDRMWDEPDLRLRMQSETEIRGLHFSSERMVDGYTRLLRGVDA